MSVYKILLVDDEEEVRHAIATKLDWAALGFELAGEASNGVEAIEMIETLAPDVIMTDIQMPFMDGLTLCKHARDMIPDVRLAVFSGFDEFDYAREAIRAGVVEYIMKPINAEELAKILSEIAESLDKEAAERSERERLQRLYEESLPEHIRQEKLKGKYKDSATRLAEKAKAYIDEHYSDEDLSIDVVCDLLGVSASYFSVTFKKAMGVSFITMLTQIRMRAAVEQLAITDDKTYIIAEKVGYSDPNYFSYVFKKYYGISPTKYRTERLKATD
ncbi:MAG: response regulator [Clostridiales Family XIII bacterium]|jgi:YesN/AraC family two-component response regulator|nr:response regulator [Clostridiales Family XIII bacterium]